MKKFCPRSTNGALQTVLWLALSFAICAPFASAAITVDGSLGDWGVSPGPYGNPAQWTPNSGVFFTQEDTNPAVSFLDPGWGGQDFDVEAAYFTREGNTAYFAIVSGFPLAGRPGYAAGDLAIDFGSDGSFEFGVNTTGSNHYLYGNATWIDPTSFPVSNPYALAGGTQLGGVQFGYNSALYAANGHYAFEIAVPISLFGSSWMGLDHPDFTVHWTMSCGNDAIDLRVPPRSAVPEPVSSVLMLLGVGGLALTRRKLVG